MTLLVLNTVLNPSGSVLSNPKITGQIKLLGPVTETKSQEGADFYISCEPVLKQIFNLVTGKNCLKSSPMPCVHLNACVCSGDGL